MAWDWSVHAVFTYASITTAAASVTVNLSFRAISWSFSKYSNFRFNLSNLSLFAFVTRFFSELVFIGFGIGIGMLSVESRRIYLIRYVCVRYVPYTSIVEPGPPPRVMNFNVYYFVCVISSCYFFVLFTILFESYFQAVRVWIICFFCGMFYSFTLASIFRDLDIFSVWLSYPLIISF